MKGTLCRVAPVKPVGERANAGRLDPLTSLPNKPRSTNSTRSSDTCRTDDDHIVDFQAGGEGSSQCSSDPSDCLTRAASLTVVGRKIAIGMTEPGRSMRGCLDSSKALGPTIKGPKRRCGPSMLVDRSLSIRVRPIGDAG
jgi:hypothetical protein